MPIEIRELIIRASVGNPNQGGSNNSTANDQEAAPKEEIIKECVGQVMEIIKDKKER
ncbi:DUF5908 family protein [Segetibacter aerophilus]|uniref:Uncharacterized protein n=1 Tax=Segetibacter aerophilus TaxID=670293 RepID=A0A512BJ00_9BACT|nr:DUF5908 family protein [Segetibacter aerophilus]GEO11934.1 hypothetical protein SAE01_44300 [Segetibacter aerophilus]